LTEPAIAISFLGLIYSEVLAGFFSTAFFEFPQAKRKTQKDIQIKIDFDMRINFIQKYKKLNFRMILN
jgi:hypothetical protein